METVLLQKMPLGRWLSLAEIAELVKDAYKLRDGTIQPCYAPQIHNAVLYLVSQRRIVKRNEGDGSPLFCLVPEYAERQLTDGEEQQVADWWPETTITEICRRLDAPRKVIRRTARRLKLPQKRRGRPKGRSTFC
jgi:hypothetical protein